MVQRIIQADQSAIDRKRARNCPLVLTDLRSPSPEIGLRTNSYLDLGRLTPTVCSPDQLFVSRLSLLNENRDKTAVYSHKMSGKTHKSWYFIGLGCSATA